LKNGQQSATSQKSLDQNIKIASSEKVKKDKNNFSNCLPGTIFIIGSK